MRSLIFIEKGRSSFIYRSAIAFFVGRRAIAGRVLVECFQEIERGCQVSEQGTQLQRPIGHSFRRNIRDPQQPAVIVGNPDVLAVGFATEVLSQH